MSQCKFCSKTSLYTCPKCNALYCSSNCYKSSQHASCSENFYQKQFEEQLKGSYAPKESKKKMEEILRKLHEEDGENEEFLDSDDEEELTDRMAGVDLDDADAVWSKLLENEKQEFLQIIYNGRSDDIIPSWQPWWERSFSLVVTEVKESSRDVPAFMEVCPPHKDCLPLSSILKTEPSICIPFNIINVLASYVWIVRLFNGDHLEIPIDATEGLLILCPVLAATANYSSAQIAVDTPNIQSQEYSWLRENDDFASNVRKDVTNLIRGPNKTFQSYFVASALSDAHSLLRACKSALSSHARGSENCSLFLNSIGRTRQEVPLNFTNKESVKKALKKLEFFLAYLKKFPRNICMDL